MLQLYTKGVQPHVAFIGCLGLQLLALLLAHVDRRVGADGGGGEERAEEALGRVDLLEEEPPAKDDDSRLELTEHLVRERRARADDQEAAPVDQGGCEVREQYQACAE